MFLTEKRNQETGSTETNGVHTPNLSELVSFSQEHSSTPEKQAESGCGPESCRSSSLLCSPAPEGDGCSEDSEGLCGFSRPGSEAHYSTSNDSSSFFDDYMQRTDCPSFCLPEPTDEGLAGCPGRGEDKCQAKPQDYTSEELNKWFHNQKLDSSSSSSDLTNPSSNLVPAFIPKRPNAPQDPRDTPASPKQPRLRTPTGLGLLNIFPAKRHLSQLLVSEAMHNQIRKHAISMLRPLQLQETDLDQQLEDDVVASRDNQYQDLQYSQTAPIRISESWTDMSPDCSTPGSKPPTPPIHRLPSWVRQFPKPQSLPR